MQATTKFLTQMEIGAKTDLIVPVVTVPGAISGETVWDYLETVAPLVGVREGGV